MFQSITLFGHEIMLYGLFNALSVVGQIIFLAFTVQDYRSICTFPIIAEAKFIKKEKVGNFRHYIFPILELLFAVGICSLINTAMSGPISKLFLGKRCANFFPNIFVSPILMFLLCIPFKVSPLKAVDYASTLTVIALIFYKIACYFEGCCYGIAFGSTFFNHYTNRYEFPIQLLELGCAILMFAVLLYMRKHKKRHGLMYPSFMLMYCGMRFFSEFLRDDFPAVWGRLTGYHIQCLIGFALGLVYLLLVLKYGERLTEYFESKNKIYLENRLKILKKKSDDKKRVLLKKGKK